ncbi:MAG: enoyl-CoA hydratase/isomerase family protein, partial [Dethiobacteria bacterium]
MAREFISWVLEDNVAVLTINNPPMNVISTPVSKELLECFREIDANEDCRALVVTGAGDRAFMAGADIKEFPEMLGVNGSTYAFSKLLHETFLCLEGLSIPTIAAVNGY